MFQDNSGAIVADFGSSSIRIGFSGDNSPQSNIPNHVGVIATSSSSCSTSSSNGKPSVSSSSSSSSSSSFHNKNISSSTSTLYTRDTYLDSSFTSPSSHQSDMEVDACVRDGVIVDWELYEKHWDYAIANKLKCNMEECPIMLSEKPYNTSKNRHDNVELMFEKYNIPLLFMARDATLSCYAVGRTTGMLVDIGSTCTTVTPVNDGWVETKALNRCFIGGRQMDAYLYQQIAKNSTNKNRLTPFFRLNNSGSSSNRGSSSSSSDITATTMYDAFARLELARSIKESIGECSQTSITINTTDDDDNDHVNNDKDDDKHDAKFVSVIDPRIDKLPKSKYVLPDGHEIELGFERFVSEILFEPTLYGSNSRYDDLSCILSPPIISNYLSSYSPLTSKDESLPSLIYNSILRSDPELHQSLFQNLIVTGGGSAFESLPERVKLEMEKLVPGVRVKLLATSPNERVIGTWLGGSIVASLGGFNELCLSKKEYDEGGPATIDRKCP